MSFRASLSRVAAAAHYIRVGMFEVDYHVHEAGAVVTLIEDNGVEELDFDDQEIEVDERGECLVKDQSGTEHCLVFRMDKPITYEDLET